MTPTEVHLKQKAWESVIHAYGTAAIFRKRAARLKSYRRLRDFFGIALPIIAGFFAANVVGQYQSQLAYVLGLFALGQLLVIAWSMVAAWDDSYSYASNAVRENEAMWKEWEGVGRSQGPGLKSAFTSAESKDRLIQERDMTQGISDKERRLGMRNALLYAQKKCAICGLVPKNMKPTDCDCCGNF